MEEVPDGPWTCPRCACDPLPGKVEKILTWRWKEDDSQKNTRDNSPEAGGSKKKAPPPIRAEREFFIKWKDQSYWHCSWVKEIQLDVFHPQTHRMYLRKNDMDEPPRFDEDGEDDHLSRRLKNHKKKHPEDPLKLYSRFFRYGIRPEWLQIHHICNKRYVFFFKLCKFVNY